MRRLLCFACALTLAACSSNSPAGTPDSGPDSGPDAGPDAGPSWSAAVTIDNAGAGLDLTSATDPNGRPAIAYFVKNGTDNYSLVVARELTDGVWTAETLPAAVDGGTSLTGHFGVALTFDNSGNPAVAYLGGNTSDSKGDGRWHSNELDGGASLPSESVIAVKASGSWTQQIVATHSDSLVSTPFAVDNMGTVTGLWPGLAFDSAGNLHLVLRDIHFGNDASAYNKSNLEYRQATGFNQAKSAGELVEPSNDASPPGPSGSGTYMKMAIWNNNPIVSFALSNSSTNDSQRAYFAMRTAANTWTTQQLSTLNSIPGNGPSLAVQPGVGIAIGILNYSSGDGDLVVASSSDAANFTVETVEALGDTGHHPSVAYANSTLGVLYSYCRAPTDPTNQCNANAVQLRFREHGAASWGDLEPVASVYPDSTALIGDGNGHFVAVYKDPAGGLLAKRRSP